jgi:hypothetical protein
MPAAPAGMTERRFGPESTATRHRARALYCAAAVTLLALGWQYLTVTHNFGGNWTALFCTGDRQTIPPALAPELYIFRDSGGYDGQFYHYMAHDPWFREGLAAYIDSPRMRARRILVPALAHILGGGRSVHAAYIGVVLLALFAGVYWTGRFLQVHGRHPAWSGLFLLLPATVVSLDRMTVDIALAAATAGFCYFYATNRYLPLWLIAMAAPLIRDTGFLLPVALGIDLLMRRRIRDLLLLALTPLPALAWWGFVALKTPAADVPWISWVPLAGFFHYFLHPGGYSFGPLVSRFLQALDLLALLGAGLAIALSARLAFRRRFDGISTAAALFALLGGISGEVIWVHVYSYGRTLTPLLLLAALGALPRSPRWELLPLALIAPRLLAHVAFQALGAAQSIFGLART